MKNILFIVINQLKTSKKYKFSLIMDFYKYSNLLIECISDCLPSEIIPKKFNNNITEIINFANNVESIINENVKISMENPIVQILNNDEKIIWLQKMKEKERIELLKDVSEKEYNNFILQLEECIKQWSLWGWELPKLNYNTFTIEITDDINYDAMTEENFINWLLLNWLSSKPSIQEGKNCMNICVRTWFYPIIKSNKIDNNLIKLILDIYNKYDYITTMFPKEWEWKKESQKYITLYVKNRIDELFKKYQDVSKKFIDLVKNLLEFQNTWNIIFNETELILKDLTSDYLSKYIIPYFGNNIKNMEATIINSKLIEEYIDDKLLGSIKGEIDLVFRLDNNHNILRLLHIYIKYLPNILKKIYDKRIWTINIYNLEIFIDSFDNLINFLKMNYINPLIQNEINLFNDKIDWNSLITHVLEESIEWKKLLENKKYEDIYNLCIEWSQDKVKLKYLRRFIQIWTSSKLIKYFNTIKLDKLEDELCKLGDFKNNLIEIENSELWIEPLELFLCIWLNKLKDNPNIKNKNIFEMINFSKINIRNKLLNNGYMKIKKIL